jgi:hypothetical protein
MANWEGHKPATRAVLLDVITTATSGSAKLSLSDRILFNACEFWASVRNHTLLCQLAADADSQLQAAETSFTMIGLAEQANVVRRARLTLTEPGSERLLPQVVEDIERVLADHEEYIDQTIAEFANRQSRDRRRS